MPAEEAKLMVFQTGCKPTLPSSSSSCIQACKPQVQYKTMLLADTNNSSFNQQETSETHLENVRKLCSGPFLLKDCRKIINYLPLLCRHME